MRILAPGVRCQVLRITCQMSRRTTNIAEDPPFTKGSHTPPPTLPPKKAAYFRTFPKRGGGPTWIQKCCGRLLFENIKKKNDPPYTFLLLLNLNSNFQIFSVTNRYWMNSIKCERKKCKKQCLKKRIIFTRNLYHLARIPPSFGLFTYFYFYFFI